MFVEISPNFSNMPNLHDNLSNKNAQILLRYGYRLGQSIGQGAYSKVRLAIKMNDSRYSQKVACKSIDKKRASMDYVQKFLPRELGILKLISHPNIVAVHDIFVIRQHVYIFMDLCEKGDLLEYILCQGQLPENRAKHLFRQLVSAIEYLHNLDITHRDLKCENVLLSSNDTLKITDFGFARRCRDGNGNRILSDTFCGSAAYAAPEIILGLSYNPKMYDVWSLGCILYIMLTACMPFDDTNLKRMLKTQIKHNITVPARCDTSVSQMAKSLVWHLLQPDVTKRATIRQVARSSWLKTDSERTFDNSNRLTAFVKIHDGCDKNNNQLLLCIDRMTDSPVFSSPYLEETSPIVPGDTTPNLSTSGIAFAEVLPLRQIKPCLFSTLSGYANILFKCFLNNSMGGFRFPRINLDSLPLSVRNFGNRALRRRPMEVLPRTSSNENYIVFPAIKTAKPRTAVPPKIRPNVPAKTLDTPNSQQANRVTVQSPPSRNKLIRQGTYSVLEPKVVKGPTMEIDQGQREKRTKGLHGDKNWKDAKPVAVAVRKSINKHKVPFTPPNSKAFCEKNQHPQKNQSFWIDL